MLCGKHMFEIFTLLCHIDLIQRLKLRVESEGFCELFLNAKIVDCWVSFPGRQKDTFWFVKHQKSEEKGKSRQGLCRYDTLIRLVSLFQYPSLSDSIFLRLLPCFFLFLYFFFHWWVKMGLVIWEGGLQWRKMKIIHYSPQMHLNQRVDWHDFFRDNIDADY